MYIEDDYIQLSAVQHYVFCPRQCGLIHVHGLWAENLFTTRGQILHERVDSGEDDFRDGKHIARSITIISNRLGLSGRADVVEFSKHDGKVFPYPVEYKSGKPKNNISDSAQLCAQALCLEEMMNIKIERAAFYYGKPRKRHEIELTGSLRTATENIIEKVHLMVKTRIVPEAKQDKRCKLCSLKDICMPSIGNKKISYYLKGLYKTDEETS